MKPIVLPLTVDEAFDSPKFVALCNEYRAESLRNPDGESAVPDRAAYENMIAAGIMRPLGVFVDNDLVGFCAVLITPVPHYGGRVLASTETLFVARAHRAGGAGITLLRAAEDVAHEAGASGLYVSAPVGGVLERVLPGLGYHETNRVFFRGRT
ncbi:MAG TPA: GNAT family N-acetyltransferase [Castellaniella sp.]|uniref:GNAT family N-acetyltransferase n=1 Tax=Castellaniella sp. TaxID=1955812 RepID=UPI002F06189D